NKGKVYIAESSPPSVSNAYIDQFKEDFALFLRSRAEELDAHGRMVLILTGRIGHDHVDRGNSLLWELLSRSLAILAAQVLNDKGLASYKPQILERFSNHFLIAGGY
ncbi:unnamed protein product, partial [Linum tenue]